MPIKTILGIIAILLTFISFAPYIRDILKNTTKPHVYSWFLWAIITFISFALQLSDSAGIGSLVTLIVGLMCLVVLALSLIKKIQIKITKSDTLFLILSLISLILWLVAKQDILSSILVTIVGLLAFAPTIRKSWHHPHSESVSFYLLSTLRYILAILALNNYSIITILYPITWLTYNGLFALMLIIRRRQIASNPDHHNQ